MGETEKVNGKQKKDAKPKGKRKENRNKSLREIITSCQIA